MITRAGSVVLGLLVLAGTALASPGGVEIWITPTGSGGGSGSAADPFSAPDPDSFFDLVHDQRLINGTNFVIPEYSTIHLMPGLFRVREGQLSGKCPRHGLTPKTGWKIHGAGMDVTTLQMVRLPQAADGSGKAIIIGGNGGACINWNVPLDDVEVSDLTVDCNLQAQKPVRNVQGVGLSGSNNKIRRVRAINWGSTEAGNECFVLYCNRGTPPRAGGYHGGLIEECVIEKAAPVVHAMTTTAISVGSSSDVGTGWTIRNCVIRDIVTGTGMGQPTSLNAYACNGRGCEIYHNQAINLTGGSGIGFYTDTWDCQDIFIHDNVFLNINGGVTFVMGGDTATNIAVVNNLVAFANNGGGIQFCSQNGKLFTGIRLDGNIVYPYNAGASGNPIGMNGRVEFSADNNILESGPGASTECLISGAQYTNVVVLSFRNNRNLRGTRLTLSEWNQDYIFTGNYDEDFTFKPAAPGWHKLLLTPAVTSARLNLWCADDNAQTDIDLAFRHYPGIPNGDDITLLYNGSQPNRSGIPKVRLAQYRTFGRGEKKQYASGSFDIYINPVLVGKTVNVHLSGMLRPVNYVKDLVPYLASKAPASSKELTIVPGGRNNPSSAADATPGAVKGQPFTLTLCEVDAATPGDTPLLTVPPGLNFIATALTVETSALADATASTAPIIGLGSSVSQSNIVSLVELNAGGGVAANTYRTYSPRDNAPILSEGSVLTFRVASAGPAQKLCVHVTGFYR